MIRSRSRRHRPRSKGAHAFACAFVLVAGTLGCGDDDGSSTPPLDGGETAADGGSRAPCTDACDACSMDGDGCSYCVDLSAGEACVSHCVGETCTYDCGADLAIGLVNSMECTCVEPLTLGAPCDHGLVYNPCEAGAYCEKLEGADGGECLPVLEAGELCGTTLGAGEDLGNARGTRGCVDGSGCVPVYDQPEDTIERRCTVLNDLLVDLGEPCGSFFMSEEDPTESGPLLAFCSSGYCDKADLEPVGTCVAPASIGEDCDLRDSFEGMICETGAGCVDGVCTVPMCD